MLNRMHKDDSLSRSVRMDAMMRAGQLEQGYAEAYQTYGGMGMWEGEIRTGFRFVQEHGGGRGVTINNGGVHFHGQYEDPAGAPRKTGME